MGLSAIFDVLLDCPADDDASRYRARIDRLGGRLGWTCKGSRSAARQAQGSKGWARPETAAHITASRVEQGLEVPVAKAVKDEGARVAVNRPGRPGRVTRPRHRTVQIGRCPLHERSKASKGGNAWWGVAVAAMKHHEPQDGKSGAIPGQGREGENRQGGAKPRRRRARRAATRLRSEGGDTDAGCGLLDSQDRSGAIFGNP